jgi:hypothetical protein
MLYKQDYGEQKEKFAFGLLSHIENDLFIEKLIVLKNEVTNATKTSIDLDRSAWDILDKEIKNMDKRKLSAILTLHTHPSGFGAGRTDAPDEQSYKEFAVYIEKKYGVVNINGVVADDGIALRYREPTTGEQFSVKCYSVDNNGEKSKTPMLSAFKNNNGLELAR